MKEELKILEEPVKKKLPACTVILYVLAAASLICAGFMLYYSITYVQSYYESYGMSISDGITEVIQYVISGSGTYLGFAVLFWAAGLILAKLSRLDKQNRGETSGSGVPQGTVTMESLDPALEEDLRDPEEDGADSGEKAAEAESEEKSPAQDEPEKKSD